MTDDQLPPDAMHQPVDTASIVEPSVTAPPDPPKLPEPQGKQPASVVGFPDGAPVKSRTPLQESALAFSRLPKRIQQVKRQERRRQAYELWLRDLTFDQIGRTIGVTAKTAWYDVRAYAQSMARLDAERVAPRREQLSAQMARVKQKAWTIAEDARTSAKDRIAALQTVVQAADRQARLEGVDAPLKVASTTPDGTSWAPLQVHLQQLSTEEIVVLKRLAQVRVRPALPEGERTDVVEGEAVGEAR